MSDSLRVGVLIFRDLARPGGTSIRTCGITDHLVDYGCEVTLINSYPPPPELSERVKSTVIGPESVPGGSFSLLYTAFPNALFWLRYAPDVSRLRRILRSQNVDILHVHKHESAYKLLRLRSAIGVPILFDVHGIMQLQTEDLALLGASDRAITLHLRAERNVLRRADAVSVVSSRMKDYVIDEFGLVSDRVYVIPDAADDRLFSREVDESEKAALRAEHNLTGKRVILFAGSFKKLGGILDLAEAYRRLSQDMQEPIALIMIGDGQLMPDIREFKRRYGLADLVLLGRLPHFRLPPYQSIADVLVVPECASKYNDMVPHIKLLECLASGRPTVATKLPVVSEIVEDGKNGILVEPSQPKRLAEGIARVLRDESLQKRLGDYARQTISGKRTWRHSAQKAAQAYRSILSGSRAT